MRLTPHDKLSAHIAQWNSAWLPDNVFATAIAHGGRFPAMAEKLKTIGTEGGVADWLVVESGRALFAELKSGKANLSTLQRKTRIRTNLAGAETAVIHSIDEWIAQMAVWKIPLRHHARIDEFGAEALPW